MEAVTVALVSFFLWGSFSCLEEAFLDGAADRGQMTAKAKDEGMLL